MANTVYIMEAANLFCGDHDPASSKHLTIEEWTLPDLQAMYADFHPGGSFVAMEFEVGVQKLVSAFKLKGFDPDTMKLFGIGSQLKTIFTGYGLIRDKRTGKAIEAKAIFEGRLGKVTPDAFKRGDAMGHSYSINEVSHYELWFDGAELYYWDFFTNTYRVGGVDQLADVNRILQVPNIGA